MGFHSLTIGASALAAANYGLQITGQNLSNMNTTGYSRQVLTTYGTANYSARLGNSTLGSGVSIKSVARVANNYAEKQLRQATSSDSYYENLQSCYSNIQAFFNEPGYGTALSDLMNDFWNSVSDLSGHVETLAIRSTALQDAITLTNSFNDIRSQLTDYRQNINNEVKDSVSQINCLIQQVAELNRAIVTTESGGLTGVVANDLRDTRAETLRQLSEYINIDVQHEQNGSCIVSVAGRSLVYYDQVYGLSVEYEKSGDLSVAIPVFASDGYPIKAEDGLLASQLEVRDNVLKGYIDELDQLAAAFTWDFNRAYSQLRGLEPYDSLTSLNRVVDSTVTLDQLSYYQSVPEGTFQVVNGNLEVVVYNKNTGQETSVNIEIDLDGRLGPNGEPDMILWDPADPEASNSFINRLQQALDSAVPGGFKVSIDKHNQVTIESLSEDYGFCFGEDTSGILAALGMNTLFTGFGADTIGVNQNLIDNPQYMGTSHSFESGDNSGVADLLAFRNSKITRLGNQTVDEYYQGIAGRLAGEASRVTTERTAKADLLLRMFNQREQISGVSEDEEGLNLIAYQRAYQSAAKFITVIDEMYETLINM